MDCSVEIMNMQALQNMLVFLLALGIIVFLIACVYLSMILIDKIVKKYHENKLR